MNKTEEINKIKPILQWCNKCGAVNYSVLSFCLICRTNFPVTIPVGKVVHNSITKNPIQEITYLVRKQGSASINEIALKDRISLGTSKNNEIQIKTRKASKKHAMFISSGENQWLLIDLDSTIGTKLNGKRITKPEEIKVGDKIEIGEAIFQVENKSEVIDG